MLTRLLCVVSDPLELVSESLRASGLRYRRSVRALQWNMLAPTMMRAIRELRAGSCVSIGNALRGLAYPPQQLRHG